MEKPIKEVTVFSLGNSADIKHWSNVPYFFTETLIEKGIKVNRVQLEERNKLALYVNKYIFRALKLLFPKHLMDFSRLNISIKATEKQIDQAAKHFNASDAFIIINFDYTLLTSKPVLLFHDWTFEHLIKNHEHRVPYFFEKAFINQQRKAIEKASFIVSLFPDCAVEMKKNYNNPNIYYLGNVVNNFCDKELNEKQIVTKKLQSEKILFIGNYKYKSGAQLLVDAVKFLIEKHPNLSVHIIGLTSADFDALPEFVHCYGYLDKSNAEQKSTYYKLMMEARFFVNPTPVWGGFSSTIEAMYFYNPVIVAPYESFVAEFGEIIDFGAYNNEFTVQTLANNIEQMLDNSHYASKPALAHNKVKDYTWGNYIDKIINLLKK